MSSRLPKSFSPYVDCVHRPTVTELDDTCPSKDKADWFKLYGLTVGLDWAGGIQNPFLMALVYHSLDHGLVQVER